jgi:hypothetical protein
MAGSTLRTAPASREPSWASRIAAAAGVVAALLVLACSVDPTEQAQGVLLVNDLQQTVTVRQCGEDCSNPSRPPAEFHALGPGETYPVNGCADCVVNQYWAVVDTNGHVLGCVNLRFDKKTPDNIWVRLTHLVRCGEP